MCFQDEENGFFKNVNTQVNTVCAQLAADPQLANGYHAVGFSQGGQFLYVLIGHGLLYYACTDVLSHNVAHHRRCATWCPLVDNIKVSVLVRSTHGAGVYGFPKCPASASICNDVRRLLNLGAYVR
jgi:palmitoyl-protein thioesterase